MELRQVVNAPAEKAAEGDLARPDDIFSDRIASPAPISAPDDFSLRTTPQAGKPTLGAAPSRPASKSLKLPPKSTVESPCLYIGPSGQRCNRPAGASGFCSKHQLAPAGESDSNAATVKRAAAVIAVLAALWPFIADLIREIIRLFR